MVGCGSDISHSVFSSLAGVFAPHCPFVARSVLASPLGGWPRLLTSLFQFLTRWVPHPCVLCKGGIAMLPIQLKRDASRPLPKRDLPQPSFTATFPASPNE